MLVFGRRLGLILANAAGVKAELVTRGNDRAGHVHLVVNLVHPETGSVARLGLVKKRMSAYCAAYEKALGDIRCKRRFEPKAANENRARFPKREKCLKKQKASLSLAPRP